MPETLVFRCPCCGQIAPQDRLGEGTEPFPLESFLHVYGGKEKMSDADREARRGMGAQRGSGRGRMRYDDLDVSAALRANFARRIEELEGVY